MHEQPGTVSIVLVNFRGASDTLEAIRNIGEMNYPAHLLQVVVVDNASGDDSVVRLKEGAPSALLIESPENTGFAGGCNLGVRHCTGEIIAFLNNDARPAEDWVRAAVERFASSPDIGAVASKVLDWDGALVDYIGSGLTWFGMGYKPLTGKKIVSNLDVTHDVLFGTGSAMFVRRSVFDKLKGFDERFFMFFEDVDLGWRLNLLGWRFVYEPKSLAFHRHHATMDKFGKYREEYLLERNALFALYKNFSASTLAQALPAAMALAARRSVAKGAIDSGAFDYRVAGGDTEQTMNVPKVSLSGLFALDKFVEELPSLQISRDEIQKSRVISDHQLWPLFGLTDLPAFEDAEYVDGYESIVATFDVVDRPIRNNVLIITGDPLGSKLAGPAIRALNIALALRGTSVVRLVSLAGVENSWAQEIDAVHVSPGDEVGIAVHEAWADVIIFQGHALAAFATLRDSHKIIVADIYDPMHLEQLEQGRGLPRNEWDAVVSDAVSVLNDQLNRADFFLAASERQRTFWLGQLAANGRLNPANYEDDPHMRELIAVVPFGMSSTEPEHRVNVLKGVVPGIELDDKLIIWSGGLYDWFDPLTLIRAVADLTNSHPNVKLYFQGTKHPHPGVPLMPIVEKSRLLAEELGMLDRHIFFNESWVDYDLRENYLTEADVGVSTHFAHIETAFSFRTRIIDYLWAGLPMVVTKGDHFGDLVDREKLGIAVLPGDVRGLSIALECALFDDEFILQVRANIRRVREDYRWKKVLTPLIAFVANPRPAADRIADGQAARPRLRPRQLKRPVGLRNDFKILSHYLRNDGVSTVTKMVTRRILRLLNR